MSKENSFRFSTALLKYLLVVAAMSVIFILYVAKLNQIDPDTKKTGVVTDDVLEQNDVDPLLEEPVTSVASARNGAEVSQQGGVIEGKILSAFQAANQAIQIGDIQNAASILVTLINQHPELPEPYANLASLQAENGQLVEARATLLQGLQSNAAYAALFSSLQEVQGALAANAYKTALADKEASIASVELPILQSVDLRILSKQNPNLELTSPEPNDGESTPLLNP